MDLADQSPLIGRLDTPFRHPHRNVRQACACEGLSAAAVKQTVDPLVPRLLDLNGAARYLAVSPWTIRGLEAQGVLPRVRILLAGDGELRKLLFDRVDLDRLIETSKDNTTALQNGTRTSCHRRSCAS